MDSIDALELAFHRALRGEVSPAIRGITVLISDGHVRLSLFCARRDFDAEHFEETVLSELDQVLPVGCRVPGSVTFQYLPAHDFAPRLPERILVNNPWAQNS